MSVTAAVCAAALLGALVGYCVPAASYRLATAAGAPARAGCHRCQHPLAPGPLGWVRPVSRCPRCAGRLGPYPLVTLVVGVLCFGALAGALGTDPALPGFLAVAGVGLVLGAVDLACLRLPDVLVAAAGLLGATGLLGAALFGAEPGRLLGALAGAVAGGAGYLGLAALPGSQLGGGDVKLAVVLGLPLGWLGWSTVLYGLALPHVLHGTVVLGLLATGRIDRRAALPFGPALLAGALFAVLLTRA